MLLKIENGNFFLKKEICVPSVIPGHVVKTCPYLSYPVHL